MRPEPEADPTPSTDVDGQRRRWPRRLALAAVLAVGAALRLVYGWPDPGPARSWDDRFGLPNVESIVRHRAFVPVNAYHPSLSYVPQALAFAAVEACGCLELGTGTRSVLLTPHRETKRHPGSGPARTAVSPLGYRTCRILQALLGTLALAVLYRLTGRLLGPWPGVAAAALLAFVPWHLWTAGSCNEEAGMFVAVELAALATLFAARRGDPAGYALAGVAFGCALASKLNAGPVALPLAVWTLARVRREPRRLALLTVAAVVAVTTFFALNPHFISRFDLVRRDFGYTVGLYASKAAAAETSRLDVLGAGFTSPAAPEYLGLPLALLAALGLATAARKDPGEARRRSGLRLVALFPLTYVPALALATRHIKDHNWLPVLPFAIVLALAGAGALARSARRLGGRHLAAVAVALTVAAALPLAARGMAFVYGAVVPDTLELALRRLAPAARHRDAILIRDVGRDRAFVGPHVSRRQLLEIEVPRGARELDAARLAGADFWVLEQETARRLAPPAGPISFTLAPRWFVARGPALAVGASGWHLVGEKTTAPVRARWGRTAEIELAPPAVPPGAHRFSLRFGVASTARASRCTVGLGTGPALPAHLKVRRRVRPGAPLSARAPLHRAAELFFTERLATAPPAAVVLRCSGPRPLRIAEPVKVYFWAP